MTLQVTFGVKKHEVVYHNYCPATERDVWETKTIYHECDENKSFWENTCDAFEKAVSMGHQPDKNIKMRVVA